jgi:hypothetical protein
MRVRYNDLCRARNKADGMRALTQAVCRGTSLRARHRLPRS